MLTSITTAVPELRFYYHYKHDPQGEINNYAYEVVGLGFHTEDDARPGEECFVLYRALYTSLVYKVCQEYQTPCFDARPLEMWMGEVRKDGKTFPRFNKVTDPRVIMELQKIRDEMYPLSPTT